MALPLALFAAGTALSIGGSFLGGEAEKKAAKKALRLAKQQAAEILERSKINQEIAIQQGQKLTGAQASAFARGGVDVSSGSPLLAQTETMMNAKREAQLIEREAQFQARSLIQSGRAGVQAARSRANASLLGAFGSAGIGAARSGMFSKLGGGSSAGQSKGMKTGEPIKTSSLQNFSLGEVIS